MPLKLNKSRIEFYKAAREKAMRIIAALDHIINEGEPENRACSKENIQIMWFRRFCLKDISSTPDSSTVKFTAADWEPCWQERFLTDLLGEDSPAPEGFDEKFFEETCKSWVSERESQILRMYYIEDLNLTEIGKVMHITGDRVRQIQARAMRKLRYPTPRKIFCYGPDFIEAFNARRDAQAEYDKAVLRRKEESNNRIALMTEENREKALKLKAYAEVLNASLDSTESKAEVVADDLDTTLKNTTLADLELSARTYNALGRHFAESKIDANAASIVELSKHMVPIRGLGDTSKRELIDAMRRKFGIDLSSQLLSSK